MATRPMAQLLSYYDEPMSPITKAKNVLTHERKWYNGNKTKSRH